MFRSRLWRHRRSALALGVLAVAAGLAGPWLYPVPFPYILLFDAVFLVAIWVLMRLALMYHAPKGATDGFF